MSGVEAVNWKYEEGRVYDPDYAGPYPIEGWIMAEEAPNWIKGAEKIEENPEILRDSRSSQKEEEEEKSFDLNLFQIFSEGGEQALREQLITLNLRTLRGILRKHSLDPSKLAEKWKNKDRLVELIIERVAARSERGKVFKQHP